MRIKTGFLLIIIAMIMFGSYGIFLRLIPASPLVILYFYQLIGAIAFFFISIKKLRLEKTLLLTLLLFSVFAILNDFFYFNAFRLTTIANAVLTHYTAPIFVAIFAPFLLREKLTKSTVYALILSFVGLLILFYKSGLTINTDLIGLGLGVASGLMYACFILVLKKLSQSLAIYTINFYRYLLSFIILTPFMYGNLPHIPSDLLIKLILFALAFAVLATGLHTEGVRRVEASKASVVSYIEPLSAITLAVIFLSEIPSFSTILGGIMLLSGTYLIVNKG